MATIALVGNPNSGKTTLFNALTGATQFVGNWPGVTVERKEGKFKLTSNDEESTLLVDLPGIYSLSPYSMEEVIARDYILNQKPDVVINIVDASNLERNLYLTTQVLELGVPVVVALNMCDVVKKKGEKLDAKALSKELGCQVVEISAIKKTGIKELKAALNKVVNKEYTNTECSFKFEDDINAAIKTIKDQNFTEGDENNNYGALKILCNDEHYLEQHQLTEDEKLEAVNETRQALEAKYDDDIDSIIAEGRYSWINSIIDRIIVQRRKEKLSISDKIDKIITNKWLGLPIFLLIIYGIYWVCLNPNGLGKWLVGLTFSAVINFMFWIAGVLTNFGCAAWLVSLVSDGIVFGVGIVVAFVPYLMVLFFFLALLEESGYMARVAFIMDRLFRRFGLSGKSFIPMLLGTGCTVQAIASCRTIENEDDRKMTIWLTPFMPCATKMPVIILICTVLVGVSGAAWLAPLTYIMAIALIIISGLILKKVKFTNEPAPFVMELPEYKLPTLSNVGHYIWSKTVSFFRKASTIILVTTVIVWFLKYFTFGFQPSQPDLEDSMLATIGKFLCPLFAPIGLDDWKLISATITGYVAKDNVLGTLAQLFQLAPDANGVVDYFPAFESIFAGNIPQAASFLTFFLFSSPCFASMGAIGKELGDKKLTWQVIGFQMGTAYLISMVVFNVLRLFFGL